MVGVLNAQGLQLDVLLQDLTLEQFVLVEEVQVGGGFLVDYFLEFAL